ncbi:pentapeptide repeat-containing protein [Picosynechococcus sp. NKBG042902]|uniref:pentapeptide repeat-containing protein n=1 Tax=Picosynechococcus sp. NKBG042902 TaxID=490193 RepID=UPI0004AA34C3|nr:pentapeptide repeat-containing protein [Picosynechococcus sp. NKBG042902]
MNYYEILGIQITANQREIKTAYRRKAIALHPDTLTINTPADQRKQAEEDFKELNQIYEILSNPEQRQKYNQDLQGTEKADRLQKIRELRDQQNFQAAIAQAQSLYGQFPTDTQCADLYGEVLMLYSRQLLDNNPVAIAPEIKTYLELALSVVHSPRIKQQIQQLLAHFEKTAKQKKTTQHSPDSEAPQESSNLISTKRAIQLLKAGEAGIKAWNQFREYETYLPDLAGADLSGMDLSQTNLQGVNLRGADLSQANLGGTNLSQAQLMQANLTGINGELANFSQADLTEANLTDSCLVNADFNQANLTAATLNQANAHRANFQGANLQNVHWCGGNLGETNCLQASFAGAILNQTNGKKGNFTATTFTNSQWEGAVLVDADFSQGNLERMELANANLSNVKFIGARLCGTNLNGSATQGSKKYPYYQGSIDFSGADLSCATCIETVFPKSNFGNTRLQNTNFDQADLSGSNFQDAVLHNTSFLGSNLRETDLSGTKFYFAYVNDQTKITGAKGI